MIIMLATTYGESVTSMPICENGDPTGPMQKGMMYIVRPAIQPSKMLLILIFMSPAGAQLLVGPASI